MAPITLMASPGKYLGDALSLFAGTPLTRSTSSGFHFSTLAEIVATVDALFDDSFILQPFWEMWPSCVEHRDVYWVLF